MADEIINKLNKLVNSSGFPLQIGLQNVINKSSEKHGWAVESIEHPWKNYETGNDGFIDIILKKQDDVQIMVIECKRVRDANWVFLTPYPTPENKRDAKIWLTDIEDGNKKYLDWYDWTADPASPESTFCIVSGQGPNDKPMLERITSELIEATETIAIEEYKLNKNKENFCKKYFTAIVTTAELQVCNFNPDHIKIENGEIADTNFTIVPYLRFRKSFTTNKNSDTALKSLKDVATAQERTIFIINASKLTEFLQSWKLQKENYLGQMGSRR